MRMDKYELVLDIVEHPERYTDVELAEILSDPEAKEIYDIVCKTESAVKAAGKVDVDAEWEGFLQKHPLPSRRTFMWFGSRAASITAIVATSLVAVAAGIAVTVAVSERKAVAAADEKTAVSTPAAATTVATDSIRATADTTAVVMMPVMFEDQPLETIMKTVAAVYGVEVRFRNKEAATLHLYYKFDPSLSLDEVISQLNTFEQISINKIGNTITID